MRMIALAVAATLVGATTAYAQVTPPAATEPVEAMRATTTGFIQFQAADELMASDLLGTPVLNLAEETLGTVNNILYSYNGEAAALVVSVGGFLGIGVKNVAIAYDAVTIIVEDNEIRLVVDASREALDGATAFQTLDELDMAPMVPAEVATPVTMPVPATATPEPAPAVVPPAPVEPAPVVPPAPVEPAPVATPAPVPVEPAPAVTLAPALAPMAAAPAAPVDNGPMVITAPPMVMTTPMGMAPTTYVALQGTGEMLATEMIGQAVVNLAGETLGTIDNVLQTREGTVTAVIVGVGGFLGIGVKDVAISMEALNIGVIDGEWRFVFDASRETLDAAPPFERLP